MRAYNIAMWSFTRRRIFIAYHRNPFYTLSMTPDELETRWLSLRYWLLRCVLPSGTTLCLLILSLPLLLPDPTYRAETLAIFVFFTAYFVLFRGGHLIMIRSMHADLLETYGPKYEARLKHLPKDLKRQNLGFTLARIKRDLIHAN